MSESEEKKRAVTIACLSMPAAIAGGIVCYNLSGDNDFLFEGIGFWFLTALFSSIIFHWFRRWSLLFAIVAAFFIIGLISKKYNEATTFTWDERIGAICMDGWQSDATGRGACSHHGGVKEWLTIQRERPLTDLERWQSVLKDFQYVIPIPLAATVFVIEPVIWHLFLKPRNRMT